MVNDILLPYEQRSPKIQLIPGKDDIDGKIFMAEEGTKMFGDNMVAFINKGSEDGIQTGQTYAIYEEYRIEAKLDFVDFGSLLVLHTEETTATVLILRSGRSIQPPGYFRSLLFFLESLVRLRPSGPGAYGQRSWSKPCDLPRIEYRLFFNNFFDDDPPVLKLR